MYKKTFRSILNAAKLNLDGLYKSEDNAVKARQPHFIFSAENPMYPENHVYNLKHGQVVDMLKQKGYNVEEVNGHYGKPERSILVHNPSKKSIPHLLDLSKKLGQESSIYSDGHHHEMHFHGGENAGNHVKGQGTAFHKRKPDDHFTEMKDGTSFSHHFNFDEAHPAEHSMAQDKALTTKKSEIDFIKSENNHPLVNAHAGTKLIHYSPTKGMKNIDPEFQGKRITDASSKRGRPEHPVSFYYLEGAKPEALVANGSQSKYVARLGHHKVYDLGTDPDGIRKELRDQSQNRQINPGIYTRDELDGAIKAKGYHGVYNSHHDIEDMRNVVGMYSKIPVEKEVDFHPKDMEIASDVAHEQHHSVIKSVRRSFEEEDLEKGAVSPSKHIGLGRLKQIKTDNGLGEGGKEYDMGELHDSINERSNAAASKMVQSAGKQEKQMAIAGQNTAAPSFPPPMPGKKVSPIVSHNPTVRSVADQYAQARGLTLNHNIPQSKVDPTAAAKIAEAYHNAQHTPNDPHVKSSYDALINETKDQYKHMLNNGLKVSKIQPGQENPYKTSKDLFNDIKNNNHISYFPTDQGFGSDQASSDHPLLQPTEHLDAEGKPMAANDVFRIVHDYFGHAKEGNGFGPNGEEGAWKHHMQMYSPMAQKALTAETRGQNSWVNFGPHGEENRKNPANTRYADQKATVLPDFAHQHGEQSVYSSMKKNENDLKKTPAEYFPNQSGDFMAGKTKELIMSREDRGFEQPRKVVHLPNGMRYEHEQDSKSDGSITHNHFLFHPDHADPVAAIETYPYEGTDAKTAAPQGDHQVKASKVDSEHKGNGFGKMLYSSILRHFVPQGGKLWSDKQVSRPAQKVWTGFKDKAGVGGYIGKYPKNRDDAMANNDVYEDHPNYAQVKDASKFNDSQHFPAVNSKKKTPTKSVYSTLGMKKNEVIMKGAMNRIHGNYNPKKELDEDQAKEVASWVGGNSEGDDREKIPNISAAGKARASNKLMSRTNWRKNPQTNQREYLMHRQMSEGEFKGSSDGKNINHDKRTSWTPSRDKLMNTGGGIYGEPHADYNHVVSAWIPESHIGSYIPQYGKHATADLSAGPKDKNNRLGPSEYNDEQEVIVNPGHNSSVHEVHQGEIYTPPKPEHVGFMPKKFKWNKTISSESNQQAPVKSIYSTLGMKKNEVIMKGAMRKLAPFNPDKHITPEDHKATENWTSEGDDQEARSGVPAMHTNAKTRALHKLTGMTEVRRHPNTGERMYMLHRGMSPDEHTLNHKGGTSNYAPGTMTSWTPHYSVAQGFASDHSDPSTNKLKVASAWIPESEIHNVPNQTMIPDENAQFRNEHEVIVNHSGASHPHAHRDLVVKAKSPRLFLDNKINMKGEREKALKDPTTPDEMMNSQVKRTIRAEEYKRSKFGKREEISMKILAKGDISSKIRNGVVGLAVATAALTPMSTTKSPQANQPQVEQQAPKPVNQHKDRILNSILQVESSGGRNTKHKKLPIGGLHKGSSAYGKYGITPMLIKETIKLHPDLIKKHGSVLNMPLGEVHSYMDKNLGLQDEIASKHYDRLSKHFGNDPAKIAMAWINGISGTKEAIRKNIPIEKHWHVMKVLGAYGRLQNKK